MEEEIKKVNPFVEKCSDAINNFLLPFKKFGPIFKESKLVDKVLIILNFFINGIYRIKTKLFGAGFAYLIAEVAFIIYCVYCSDFFIGNVASDFTWLIWLSWILVILFAIVLYQNFRGALSRLDKINHNEDVKESTLPDKIKNAGLAVKRYKNELAAVYRYGGGITKFNLICSFILIGLPQLIQKQIVKGICYLLIEIGLIAFMVLVGGQSIYDCIHLSDYSGDRRTVLVYFIVTILLILLFLFAYICAQRITLNNEILRINDKKLTAKGEIKELSGGKAYFIYLAFPIIGAILFTVIPIVFMILVGFTDYNVKASVGQSAFSWAGLEAFRTLFDMGDNLKDFASVFSWTMIWAFLATFTCYFGGFFLAVLLNNKLVKLKPLWRSIFVIIMAVPQFVSLKLMNSLFSTVGPVNTWLAEAGLETINFWTNEYWAKFLIIVINMWVGIPYNMLLISGLLLNIPKDNYEAAEIEGASKWQQFCKITFPYIFFMTTPMLISSFVSNINNFNVIYLLVGAGGGYVQSTDIMITWLYKLTIMNSEYNLGSAIGIIMFIVSATISLVIFRKSSAYQSEEEFR